MNMSKPIGLNEGRSATFVDVCENNKNPNEYGMGEQ